MKSAIINPLLCLAAAALLAAAASCGASGTSDSDTRAADTEAITISPSTAVAVSTATQLSYINYTGYLDECTQWDSYELFSGCDYDQDGRADRIYREFLGDICNYRFEFGSGSTLLIESADPSGTPELTDISSEENPASKEHTLLFTVKTPCDDSSSYELRATLLFRDNIWELGRIQYMEPYVEHIPISVRKGENHELQLHGFHEANSIIYELKTAELYRLHNDTQEYICTLPIGPAIQNSKKDFQLELGDPNGDGAEDPTLIALQEDGSRKAYSFIWKEDTKSYVPAQEEWMDLASLTSSYTGYMDECPRPDFRKTYQNCDYDMDGKTDRIYKLCTESGCDYRVEFGNGDVLVIEQTEPGMPHISSVNAGGEDGCQILFTQNGYLGSVSYGFAEASIYQKIDGEYRRLKLPFTLDTSSGNEYENSLTCRYTRTGEQSYRITCAEAPLDAEVSIKDNIYENAHWEEYGDCNKTIYQIDIEPRKDGDRLICYAEAFDKWLGDRLVATLTFANGTWTIETLQYLEYYTEYIPITLDKEHQLELRGRTIQGSGCYVLYDINLYQIITGQDGTQKRHYVSSVSPGDITLGEKDGGITVQDIDGDGYEDFSLAEKDSGREHVFLWTTDNFSEINISGSKK